MSIYPYRTAVDAQAESRSLVEATTVFDELGMTSPTGEQTSQMETLIAQVSALIDRFLNRVLAEESVTDHFRQPANEVLRLSRYPVSEILSVTEAGVELSPDDWELNEATGELWRMSSGDRSYWSDTGAIQVSYIAGYGLPVDLPADIQRAAVEQTKAQFRAGPRDPALRSFEVPNVYKATYSVAGGDSFGESGLMSQVEGALIPYKKMAV